jgi:hypothetical protein
MKNEIKIHSTNYYNTFIEVAEDCKLAASEAPKMKNDNKTIAYLQFEKVAKNPYKYTSDEVLFGVLAQKNEISETDLAEAHQQYFSKGQPCFRASPLTKQFGYGVHADAEGKVAIFGIETEQYQQFMEDKNIRKIKAMRSAKKI